jgi:hypothetical protein
MQRKRSRSEHEAEEIEEVEEFDDDDEHCRCKGCADNSEFLRCIYQRDEANARILQEMAKKVADFTNTGMILIRKLMTSQEEQQSGLGRLDKRTRQLGTLVKKIKTGDNASSSNSEEASMPNILVISRQLAAIQDMVAKIEQRK